jgi:hypothetical protein
VVRAFIAGLEDAAGLDDRSGQLLLLLDTVGFARVVDEKSTCEAATKLLPILFRRGLAAATIRGSMEVVEPTPPNASADERLLLVALSKIAKVAGLKLKCIFFSLSN